MSLRAASRLLRRALNCGPHFVLSYSPVDEITASPPFLAGGTMPKSKLPVPFDPVPVRPRRDGWTVERQVAFLQKLADCGSVAAAAAHVGMSRESARKLRLRFDARNFRDACDAALDCGYADVEEAAMERARRGVARPIFYKGEQVGEWRQHDERLTMFLLRFRRRHRFGPEADTLPRAPDVRCGDAEEQPPFDPEAELDGCFDGLDFEPEPEEESGCSQAGSDGQ
jgi:hypothetical protein